MNTKKLLLALACAGLAGSLHANTVTFDSSVFGTGDLGAASKDFTSGGVTIHIATTDGTTHLYGKVTSGDPGETGLGVNAGLDFELTPGLGLKVTVPSLGLVSLSFGSLQPGETVVILDNGVAFGSPLTGDSNARASVDVSSIAAGDIITINGGGSGGQDILLDTIVANANVPDGGTTVAMLGGALTLLGLARRKLVA